ncbi:hypothetical protein Bca52824_078492 [Brassica carinata]|uniref:Knr4/Smi1-like domain-containing protein n=1 Tax=Brassica carinata TaxID=52824 RepID=A0A8X7PXQ8_BRACI|nr:hypothetical protein Bca52824_078492 [Brassica carinata]
MNHRLPGIISPLSYITTDPIRSSVKPPVPVYCKTTINHLKSLTGLDVSPGLTNQEISAVESSIGISFPLDLRSILQTGLPKRILGRFWGTRPGSDAEALSLVKKFVEFAPVLVPVYENFYVPSTTPNLAGNPVFRIDGDGVTVLSCDVAGFLQGLSGSDGIRDPGDSRRRRRVEFWTDVAERGRMTVARGPTRGWWSALSCDERIRACLDDAFWKLREAGWKEDEVREMMVMDGVDGDTCTEDEDYRRGGEVTTLRALLYSQEP